MKRTMYSSAQIAKKNLRLLVEVLKRMDMNIVRIAAAKWTRWQQVNGEKVKQAIDRLKTFEPVDEPYYLCFSGGKDSDCIRILADLAGVKHDIVHNLTTVDSPETVRYIKSIPNVQIEMPKYSMWQLIEKKKIPPTRLIRYCCDELKEKGGKGRIKVTGVRWAESASRKQNGGVVKIIGKPKSTIALAEEL